MREDRSLPRNAPPRLALAIIIFFFIQLFLRISGSDGTKGLSMLRRLNALQTKYFQVVSLITYFVF